MLCYLVYEKTDKHFMRFTPLDDGNNAFCNEFEDSGTRALLVVMKWGIKDVHEL